MKRVLLDNAYEAWRSAIKYCDAILEGIGTLFYQKSFISALHNAVELFFKQVMIDDVDHSVAELRRLKDKSDARLCLDYMESTDLNQFFSGLPDAQLGNFKSIDFREIVDKFNKVTLKSGEVIEIKSALKRLQELRNNETHFMINRSGFLSEMDYKTLYNFMICFYRILKDKKLLPFWGEPWGEDIRLSFDREPINSFSYLDALKGSTLARGIASHLSGTYDIGSPTCTSFDIASELCRREERYETQFDDVWALIEMFQMNGLIQYKEIVEELPEEIDSLNQHPNVYYVMSIDL